MPRRGRKRKKTRTHVVETDERVTSALHSNDELKIPRSLVIRRGKTESELVELVSDLRKLMRPYTAANFKEDARNRKVTLKHYANSLSSSMGITHILALSQNSSKITLRAGRAPGGPTLSFRVKRFTLGRQVRAIQRRPYDSTKAFDSPPVVVTNNFGDASAAPHVKLMRITFQNMFPAINVSTVKLGDCKRVVLFNFIRREKKKEGDGKRKKSDGDEDDLEDEEVEVRHYAIRAKPVGVDRKVRRLVESKVPNLSRLDDIADYITNSGPPGSAAAGGGEVMSDSEAEDDANQVVLPGKYRGRGNNASQKSALKLVELGPRLRLKLYKVERELASGDVMYHAYETKTPEEAAALKKRKDGEAALKKRRREEQEANVERKRRAKEEKKEAREKRRKEREERAMAELRGEAGAAGGEDEDDDESESEEESSDDGGDRVGSEESGSGEEEESESEEEEDDEE